MLKIFEKNSIWEALSEYWKLFAGWVTDLKNRYWSDPFFRSEVKVIILQLAFAGSLFFAAFIFFDYIYQDILKATISGILESIIHGRGPVSTVTSGIEIMESNKFKIFSIVIFFITLGFTYIVARLTLRPLKRSLSSQKRFIADIAHELRTPLSIIKTNGEVLMMDDALDPKIKKVVNSNIEELDRMSGIINNLLSINNIVKPERAKFKMTDLGQIIDSVIEKLNKLALKKEIKIIVSKNPPYIVWGNASALEQITTNLLKNAIDYTKEGGQVTVKVHPDYVGNVTLSIEDNGIGISKNDLRHIFEPFYKAEQSRKRRPGSSGLGLTIVSELVKMHSGSITIKSTENKGTEAIVTLPYNKNIGSEEGLETPKINEVTANYFDQVKI